MSLAQEVAIHLENLMRSLEITRQLKAKLPCQTITLAHWHTVGWVAQFRNVPGISDTCRLLPNDPKAPAAMVRTDLAKRFPGATIFTVNL